MSNGDIPEIFVDGIINVSHSNGVFRITFGQQETPDSVRPNIKLLVPSNQVSPIIQSLGGAVNDIAAKLKESRDAGAKPADDAEVEGEAKKPAAKSSKKPAAKKGEK